MRTFNTTDPVRPSQHYCLFPLERFNLNDVLFFIILSEWGLSVISSYRLSTQR